jgi:hypothetical protein
MRIIKEDKVSYQLCHCLTLKSQPNMSFDLMLTIQVYLCTFVQTGEDRRHWMLMIRSEGSSVGT